jgi:hypothetical protein
MLKKTLCCTAVLCVSMLGPIQAQQVPSSPPSSEPGLASASTQILDYTHVFAGTETREQGKPSGPAIMATISIWLTEQFDLPATVSQPQVELVPVSTIVALRGRPFGNLQTPTADESTVLALYEDSVQTIYLPEGWIGVSPAEQSVLVHEMVHHLQSRGNLRYDCPQAREKLALAAQDRWLHRFESSLAKEFGIDPFTLFVRTSCLG